MSLMIEGWMPSVGSSRMRSFAPLGHIADARACALVRFRMREDTVIETNLTGGGGDHAHEGAKERGLADAIAPQQRRHLSRRHLEREVPQDVTAAVVLVEVVY